MKQETILDYFTEADLSEARQTLTTAEAILKTRKRYEAETPKRGRPPKNRSTVQSEGGNQ